MINRFRSASVFAHLVLTVLLTMLSAAVVHAQPATAPAQEQAAKRPAYSPVLRQNEDWSVLRQGTPAGGGDLFDPLKYIPLSDDGDIYLTLGGQARMRVENWTNFNFAQDNDDTFLVTRLRLSADLHVGPMLRFFAEGKSALSTERDLPGARRTLDEDDADLQQGFADLILPLDEGSSVTLRGGRQMLLLGKQRLVSPLDWSNTMRSWDGISAIAKIPGWSVTGFWAQFDPVQKYSFNDPDAQTQFWGLYAVGKVPSTAIGLDLYYLGFSRDDAVAFNGTTGTEKRHTVGGRLFGAIGSTRLDYDLEGAYQTGRVGPGDVDAFMVSTELGYRIPECPCKTRFFAGFDYASGDGSPGGDVQSFNQLFPLGHAFLGYIDTVGRQNNITASVGASAQPIDKLTTRVAGHFFWLADPADALYNAGGGVVRGGGTAGERYVGAEIDLTAEYQFDRHLLGLIGYSHFFAGDMLDQSGSSEDVDFVYASLQYTF